MKREVRLSAQVIAYSKRLAPEPRRSIKHALAALGEEKGDIQPLEGSLVGFCRLRVGRFRLIFAYASDNAIDVLFIEERSLVYEVFESEFIKRLKG
ncbi:MAG: hypothetical protein SFV32_12265 [Opitutaceae bacterium]|nr:hypothetical protein [Opitutaceae bacterium]